MQTEGGPSPAEKGRLSEHKPGLKEKATHQLREFLVITIYLWALFVLLIINQSVVLARAEPDYQAYGFAIFNALMLAKVLLTGEDLKFGSRFKDKPLLYSISYKCFIFTLFLIGFHIVERVIGGVLHGKSIAQSFPDVGGGSAQGILSLGVTVFVALIPFFAFREIARVIGHNELWSLLLSRGTRIYTLQSKPQQ
ncbi:MAG: hypothetical protein JO170_31975 [Verrucomicrobia bacterium]|nr:hypothetical protein [Verrucomicrobiota bacterium]